MKPVTPQGASKLPPPPSLTPNAPSPNISSAATPVQGGVQAERALGKTPQIYPATAARRESHDSTPGHGSRRRTEGGSDSERVRVVVRLRPPLGGEDAGGALAHEAGSNNLVLHRPDAPVTHSEFCFDTVLSPEASQHDVFNAGVRDVVDDVMNGYNGTVMAYGQTGTGKTYTLGNTQPSAIGMIPRAVAEIFQRANADQFYNYHVSMAYIQIYMELIQDLLRPESENLQIREDAVNQGGVYVAGVHYAPVSSLQECLHFLELGERNRTFAFTDLNAHSSRSHAVVMVNVVRSRKYLTAAEKAEASKAEKGGIVPQTVKVGKLYLVDLAGSERLKKSKSVGLRASEARSINLSLTTLGMCISSRAADSAHVPFRDSKLTRLLQESLGGNAKTTLLLCVASAREHVDETLQSLQFGSRAMCVKNKPVVNERSDFRALHAELLSQLDQTQDTGHLMEVELYRSEEEREALQSALLKEKSHFQAILGALRAEADEDKMKAHEALKVQASGLEQTKQRVVELEANSETAAALHASQVAALVSRTELLEEELEQKNAEILSLTNEVVAAGVMQNNSVASHSHEVEAAAEANAKLNEDVRQLQECLRQQQEAHKVQCLRDQMSRETVVYQQQVADLTEEADELRALLEEEMKLHQAQLDVMAEENTALKESIRLAAASHETEMGIEAASAASRASQMEIKAAAFQQQLDALVQEGSALRAQVTHHQATVTQQRSQSLSLHRQLQLAGSSQKVLGDAIMKLHISLQSQCGGEDCSGATQVDIIKDGMGLPASEDDESAMLKVDGPAMTYTPHEAGFDRSWDHIEAYGAAVVVTGPRQVGKSVALQTSNPTKAVVSVDGAVPGAIIYTPPCTRQEQAGAPFALQELTGVPFTHQELTGSITHGDGEVDAPAAAVHVQIVVHNDSSVNVLLVPDDYLPPNTVRLESTCLVENRHVIGGDGGASCLKGPGRVIYGDGGASCPKGPDPWQQQLLASSFGGSDHDFRDLSSGGGITYMSNMSNLSHGACPSAWQHYNAPAHSSCGGSTVEVRDTDATSASVIQHLNPAYDSMRLSLDCYTADLSQGGSFCSQDCSTGGHSNASGSVISGSSQYSVQQYHNRHQSLMKALNQMGRSIIYIGTEQAYLCQTIARLSEEAAAERTKQDETVARLAEEAAAERTKQDETIARLSEAAAAEMTKQEEIAERIKQAQTAENEAHLATIQDLVCEVEAAHASLSCTKAGVAQIQGHLDTLSGSLDEREAAYVEVRAQLDLRDAEIAEAKGDLEELNVLLARNALGMTEQAAELSAELSACQSRLVAVDAELATTSRLLSDRDAELKDTRSRLVRSLDELAACRAQLDLQDAELANRRVLMAQQDSRLLSLGASISQAEAELAGRCAEISDLEISATYLEAQVKGLKEDLDSEKSVVRRQEATIRLLSAAGGEMEQLLADESIELGKTQEKLRQREAAWLTSFETCGIARRRYHAAITIQKSFLNYTVRSLQEHVGSLQGTVALLQTQASDKEQALARLENGLASSRSITEQQAANAKKVAQETAAQMGASMVLSSMSVMRDGVETIMTAFVASKKELEYRRSLQKRVGGASPLFEQARKQNVAQWSSTASKASPSGQPLSSKSSATPTPMSRMGPMTAGSNFMKSVVAFGPSTLSRIDAAAAAAALAAAAASGYEDPSLLSPASSLAQDCTPGVGLNAALSRSPYRSPKPSSWRQARSSVSDSELHLNPPATPQEQIRGHALEHRGSHPVGTASLQVVALLVVTVPWSF
eukprot:gene3293-13319_t